MIESREHRSVHFALRQDCAARAGAVSFARRLETGAVGAMPRVPTRIRGVAIAAVFLAAAALPLRAASIPIDVESFVIEPDVAFIRGAGNSHILLFTAIDSNGNRRDVSSEVAVSIDDPEIIRTVEPGVFEAQQLGFAKVSADYGGLQATAAVIVQPRRSGRIDFATEVAPVFSQHGCSNTNCHGALNGQNGFKLSLFGYDPDADYNAIVRQSDGRRINLESPEESLLLQKPTFAVAHGGGRLIEPGGFDYEVLIDWIRGGAMKNAGSVARLQRIEVFPGKFTVLDGPGSRQQIVVVGLYSDGSKEDLTRRVQYSTDGEAVLRVSPRGEVTAQAVGEGTVLVRTLGHVTAVRVGVAAREISDRPSIAPANFIDELVFDKLAKLNLGASELSTDEEFIRRVYLDTIGIVPTVEETRRFLSEPAADKRARLIDGLLTRPEYAEFWAAKWGDLFANSVLTSSDGTAYLQDWLRRAFDENTPYDRFVTEILTATGSTWEVGAVNFFSRSTEDITTLTAQAFLGVSIECARCHDHPSAKWSRDDFLSMAAFFSQLAGKGRRPPPVEAIRYIEFDKEFRHPETKQVVRPRFLDGKEPLIRPLEDRREVLADWITSKENPWFARATVNRFWNQFMGRPLVDPVDDFRVSNPSTNEVLLDRLAEDFAEHGYDLHHLIRTITNSKTYQLSSVPAPDNRDDDINYSRYYLKRLTAEQLVDSIVQITGVPQDYLGYYPGVRAVNLADPGIPSAFLDMFDRPKRDAAKCERNESVSLRQAMHLLVGDTVNEKIQASAETGELARALREGKTDQEIVDHFYLASLSRLPEAEEKDYCQTVMARAGNRSKGLQNVLWALLSTNEFLYNH